MINAKRVLSIATTALLFGFSGQALALSMECSVNMTTATSGGLMPIEKAITLNATEIQQETRLELAKCSDTTLAGMTVKLCAIEDGDAAGVFHAELSIEREAGGDELDFTAARDILALSKKQQRALVSVVSESALSPHFVKKMDDANMTFPEYKGGDSLMIDEAVAAAFKKGVLNKSDVVTVGIERCRIK
ncbi:MAG: hypothetical protein OM95_12830 [Bdellovibrio sp. ArHS]|uniref:hypothetical protein n=1 Tax=Bdellovibrio sp. ArHS TaxID=1569284 RepID=UPI000583A2F9|nr:hypothetical protein [Bdellovibrio sp. ArHS]KHD87706.1 MAG: hypothetical protein OM95_12830 [Bdellovibrio sp. ArHS]